MKYLQRTISLIILAVLLTVVAWRCEDYYITMRIVDNFSHGLGIVYNLGQRVQGFSHPLWFFLLSGAYLLLQDANLIVLFLSIPCAITGFYLLLRSSEADWTHSLFFLALTVSSKCIIEYATGGLENPLAYLLIILFLERYYDSKLRFPLPLLVALTGLCRLDLLVLILPATFLRAYQSTWSFRTLKKVCLQLSPFFLWHLFSAFYFGSFFANPALSKTSFFWNFDPQVIVSGLTGQGIWISWDLCAALILLWGMICMVGSPNLRDKPILIGVFGYLLCQVLIGGDYMSGRLQSICVLVSIYYLFRFTEHDAHRRRVISLALILLMLLQPRHPLSPLPLPHNEDPLKIIWQKKFSDEYLNKLSLPPERASLCQKNDPPPGAITRTSAGEAGWVRCRETDILEVFGIVDPLISRLKPYRDLWVPGHVRRAVPVGYLQTLRSRKNKITDPFLHAYYDELKLIISAPLFSGERLEALRREITGKNRYLLSAYERRKFDTIESSELDTPEPEGIHQSDRALSPHTEEFGERGLLVILPHNMYIANLELNSSHISPLEVSFYDPASMSHRILVPFAKIELPETSGDKTSIQVIPSDALPDRLVRYILIRPQYAGHSGDFISHLLVTERQ